MSYVQKLILICSTVRMPMASTPVISTNTHYKLKSIEFSNLRVVNRQPNKTSLCCSTVEYFQMFSLWLVPLFYWLKRVQCLNSHSEVSVESSRRESDFLVNTVLMTWRSSKSLWFHLRPQIQIDFHQQTLIYYSCPTTEFSLDCGLVVKRGSHRPQCQVFECCIWTALCAVRL